jgi:hypothetical protein
MSKDPELCAVATTRDADEALLATLGYKQEFKRAFSSLEVFGIAFRYVFLTS